MRKTYKKGDIIYYNQKVINGSIQSGLRPYIVLSNNTYNYYSPIINVAPISTKVNKKSPVHFYLSKDLGLSCDSVILLEQITSVCKDECENVITHLSDLILSEIDKIAL